MVNLMAWTAPATWSTDQIVMASGSGSLNEQVRDNFLALDQHAHTGAAGDGNNTLTGVTISNTAGFQFADQTADPSVTGTIQRNGSNILYYDGSSAIDLTASDQAAGTASLRSLGTSGTVAAAGNHSHTISFTGAGNEEQVSTDGGSAWGGGDTGVIGTVSDSYTATSDDNVILTAAFWMGVTNTFGTYGYYGSAITYTVILSYNGVAKKTLTNITTGSGGVSAGIGIPITTVTFSPNGTSATAYTLTVNKTSTVVDTLILVPRGKVTISETAVTV
jgi:hypothetical protein